MVEPSGIPAARVKRRWLKGLVLAALLGGAAALALYWWSGPGVPSRALLVLDLRSPLPERAHEGLAGFFSGSGLDLLSLRRALDGSAGDPRVRAVLVRVGAGLELAMAEEIRGMLLHYRQSGKPCVAFAEGPDGPGCLVLASADLALLDPAADVQLLGVSLQSVFLGDGLRRLGLELDLVRVGEYKGAYEQLTGAAPSAEFKKTLEETADALFNTLVGEIAAGRKLTPAAVRAAIEEGPLSPARAVEVKLADRLAYQDEIQRILVERSGEARLQPIGGSEYLAEVGERGPGSRVAVVHVRGLLAETAGPALPFLGEVTGADQVCGWLREAREDGAVRGIVLRVDSPGGTIAAAERIWREVEVTRKVKPVVVTMGTAAASGGYYISCSADRVIAQPATITGSIGIFGGKVVAQSLLADHSVHLETVARGRRAGMFDLSRRFSDDQRSALERMVQDGYRLFIDRVALGRKKGLEEVERLARGRVWTGSQALERGLVDELGGMEEAVAAVRRLARIPEAEPVELAPFPSRWSLLDLLGKKRSRRSLWAAELEAAAAELQAVEPFSSFQACGRFLDGRSPLVLAPLRLDIR